MGHVTFGVELKSLYLLLSDACNIKCSFCYKKRSKKTTIDIMPAKVAMDAIDFVLNELDVDDMKLCVFLWGGEPLMNYPVVKQLLTVYPTLQFYTNTNGELITEEMYHFLMSVRDRLAVTLSMGSGRERYGDFKTYITSDNMRWAIKFIQDAHKTVNLVANDPSTLYEDFKMIYGLGIKGILVDIPTGNEWSEEDYTVFEEQFFKLLITLELDSLNINIFRNNLWLEKFGPKNRIKPHSARFCKTGLERIMVDGHGDIWQCDKFYMLQENKLGSIYSGIDNSKLEYLRKFSENVLATKEHCEKCPNYEYCPRNKCFGFNFSISGDILQPDKSWCRANTTWLNITRRYIDYQKEK